MSRIIIFLVLIFLSGCKPYRHLGIFKTDDIDEMIEFKLKNTRGMNYSLERIRIELNTGKNYYMTGKIYFLSNEYIYGNVNFFGFEVGRFLLTRDSIFYINRMDHLYLMKNISFIQSKFSENITLDLIYTLVLNGLIITDIKKPFKNSGLYKKTQEGGYIFIPSLDSGINLKLEYNSLLKLETFDYLDNRNNLFINAKIKYNNENIPENIICKIINSSKVIDILINPGKIENKTISIPDFIVNNKYREITF